ncbi:TetR family transcriptional regulator [Lactobacillus sp. S2-2]|uniref:TetR/AcrR family transcriptional regulator n=1 Tax=Lactobacillus sp. S2-2 TaxID=2692917 RepID=UPI001F26AD2A|nr:helix-turn-helix domain-containing protein [Lactobacillus sp. S2-2]MCF6515899.1 TetR family transcriptional regulator [Lactobacillus sp. S2-2]
MGRNKKYQQVDVIEKMTDLFIQKGYTAASLDDLVKVTGMLRGSLYSAFGSKQKMFILALQNCLKNSQTSDKTLGMIVISMMELSNKSEQIKQIIKDWYKKNKGQFIENLIGSYLIKKAKISGDGI